jgi:hypothetical protein
MPSDKIKDWEMQFANSKRIIHADDRIVRIKKKNSPYTRSINQG